MTPAEQTAQAVKVLVAMVAVIVVAVGVYAYVHHHGVGADRQAECLDSINGPGSPSACR